MRLMKNQILFYFAILGVRMTQVLFFPPTLFVRRPILSAYDVITFSVYMASEEERNEYVMMDVGAIWRGTTRYSSGMQWNFGQFEEGILDTTLDVLNSDKEYGSQIDVLIGRCHVGIRLKTILSVFKKIQRNCVIPFGFLVYYQLWRTMLQIEMILVF